MCGKKSTYARVRGILHYLLGPARVISAEFGPGFTTRWFLAWTLDGDRRRPRIDSPLAWNKSFAFDVSAPLLGSRGHPALDPLDEIERRVREYCASFPVAPVHVHVSLPLRAGRGRRIVVRPTARPEAATDQDGTLPDPLRRVVAMIPLERRAEWLPLEGPFSVEIVVREAASSGGGDSPSSSPAWSVSVATVAHNKLGHAVVDKIQLQLESEINRTSRKWRRILQRAQQHQDEPPPAPAEAMDES
jgi:hypothetical protein